MLPDRRLAALSSRTEGRQEIQKAGSRAGGAARTRSGARSRPLAEPRHDAATARTQLLALARFDMKAVFRSPAFFVLLGIGFINSIGGLWFANQDLYGNAFYPVTRLMIQTLNGAFTMIPLIVAIYYAGELVWRGREQRIQELVDATPAPDWAFVLPKDRSRSRWSCWQRLPQESLAAIAVQMFRGYTRFELANYFTWYVLPWTIDVTLFAVLALFIQVLVPHKFVGWLVMLVVIVSQIVLGRLGYEHNLYQYAGGPDVPLSDMNGQGHFAADRAWFRVVLERRRGDPRRAHERAVAPGRCRQPARAAPRAAAPPGRTRQRVTAAATMMLVAVGGYIFYNTNVLNEYRTQLDDEQRAADYEKALLGFEAAPQPRIVDVELNVEIFPRQLRVATTGRYTIENREPAALREIHVRWARDTDLQRLDSPGARSATGIRGLQLPDLRP